MLVSMAANLGRFSARNTTQPPNCRVGTAAFVAIEPWSGHVQRDTVWLRSRVVYRGVRTERRGADRRMPDRDRSCNRRRVDAGHPAYQRQFRQNRREGAWPAAGAWPAGLGLQNWFRLQVACDERVRARSAAKGECLFLRGRNLLRRAECIARSGRRFGQAAGHRGGQRPADQWQGGCANEAGGDAEQQAVRSDVRGAAKLSGRLVNARAPASDRAVSLRWAFRRVHLLGDRRRRARAGDAAHRDRPGGGMAHSADLLVRMQGHQGRFQQAGPAGPRPAGKPVMESDPVDAGLRRLAPLRRRHVLEWL